MAFSPGPKGRPYKARFRRQREKNGRPPTVRRYPTPDHEGHWWAKLIHPSNMPAGEDWKSVDWEVVQVYDNNGEGDETFGVFVPGVGPTQWIPDFVWGPEVVLPVALRPACREL